MQSQFENRDLGQAIEAILKKNQSGKSRIPVRGSIGTSASSGASASASAEQPNASDADKQDKEINNILNQMIEQDIGEDRPQSSAAAEGKTGAETNSQLLSRTPINTLIRCTLIQLNQLFDESAVSNSAASIINAIHRIVRQWQWTLNQCFIELLRNNVRTSDPFTPILLKQAISLDILLDIIPLASAIQRKESTHMSPL